VPGIRKPRQAAAGIFLPPCVADTLCQADSPAFDAAYRSSANALRLLIAKI
jgi:hypothetical protein